MSCVFCGLAAGGPFPLLHETADASVLLHDDWAVRGHVMIVARRHVENLSDLGDDEAARFTALWRRTERALLALTGATRSIALKLGIATPHLHVHLYPAGEHDDRETVFARIDGATREEPDPAFVEALRRALDA